MAVLYPSGNTTAVLLDDLRTMDREKLNESIMKSWKILRPYETEIEQCCFVMQPKDSRAVARIEMFGGEFCGNATRSVVKLIMEDEDTAGLVEIANNDQLLDFSVKDGIVKLEMPLPTSVDMTLVRAVPEGSLVQLDGITQLVVSDGDLQARQAPRRLLNELLAVNAYDLGEQPAVGVTFYDKLSGRAQFCVWVNSVNTMFDETACGSGTAAIGVALATIDRKSQKVSVWQPSGERIVGEAQFDKKLGRVSQAYIAGGVDILYQGDLVL